MHRKKKEKIIFYIKKRGNLIQMIHICCESSHKQSIDQSQQHINVPTRSCYITSNDFFSFDFSSINESNNLYLKNPQFDFNSDQNKYKSLKKPIDDDEREILNLEDVLPKK